MYFVRRENKNLIGLWLLIVSLSCIICYRSTAVADTVEADEEDSKGTHGTFSISFFFFCFFF